MAFKVLILTISKTDIDFSSLESKLNRGKDWLRYSPGCWLLVTGKSAQVWYDRLNRTQVTQGASVFICELNLANRSGRLSAEAWEWIKDARRQTLQASPNQQIKSPALDRITV